MFDPGPVKFVALFARQLPSFFGFTIVMYSAINESFPDYFTIRTVMALRRGFAGTSEASQRSR